METSSFLDLNNIDLTNISESVKETSTFFEKILDKLKDYLASAGINLLLGLILLIVGWRIINYIQNHMKKWKLFAKVEPTMLSFLKSLIGISLKVILIITVASILGVPMTSMITIIGSCGLALGLALQGSLSNIAGGFILAVMKPFKVGDFIISGSHAGTVKSINIFYTKIVTVDNSMIIIPNSEISNASLTDLNAFDTRRVDISVGVDYSSNTDLVKNVLLREASRNELVLNEPASQAVLVNYGDSSLDFELRVWCKASDYWTVKFGLMEAVKAAFDENGISIPFPQMDVHFDKEQ